MPQPRTRIPTSRLRRAAALQPSPRAWFAAGTGALAPLLFLIALPDRAAACEGASCATRTLEKRLERTLTDTTTSRQLQERMSGKAYDPAAHGHGPLDIGQEGSSAVVGTSLAGIRAYLSAEDRRRMEEAASLVPEGLELPQPKTALPNRLDVWTQTEITGLTDPDAKGLKGQFGADYRLATGTVVGAAIEGENRTLEGHENEGFLAGPYLATEIAPGLSLTARSAWGVGQDATAADAFATSPATETDRELYAAGLDAKWKLGETTLKSKAAFTHAREGASGAEAAVESRKLTVNPRLVRPFELDSGERIEAYVDFTAGVNVDEIEAGSATLQTLDTERAVGAGVTVSRQESYSLKASTDMKGLGDDEKRAFGANLKLDVPLN